MRSCAFLEGPRLILCIFGSFSWDFVDFWKFLVGFCAFWEVPHGILCIFGRSSWDFVHFWKLLVGLCIFESSSWDFELYSKLIMRFCAFSEDSCGILCIFESNEELPKIHKIPGETSKYAQNQARIFQKCTRSHD
jgi:hypothetical protein